MNNVSDLYTLWLKARHLPMGQPISVTIQKVETRTVHPRPTEERTALVLSFAGKNRKLILNDSNANKMADIGGEDWTGWAGLVIQLQRVKFTKDKETIHILPGATPKTLPQTATVEEKKPAAPPAEVNTINSLTQPAKTNGNGHTEKPYVFTTTASKKFYDAVQAATDNFYTDAPDLLKVIGGWFNFQSENLWDEKLSMAVDHARIKRQTEQVEVEDQSEGQ